VGPKSLAEGNVELKRRSTGERQVLPVGDVAKQMAA
jgi:prolyl-tRNA synthetase